MDCYTRLCETYKQDVPHARFTSKGATGPCPKCGSVDRFGIWRMGRRERFLCRQCRARGSLIDYLSFTRALTVREAMRSADDLTQALSQRKPHDADPGWAAAALVSMDFMTA